MKYIPVLLGLIMPAMVAMSAPTQAKDIYGSTEEYSLSKKFFEAEKVPLEKVCGEYKRHLKLNAIRGADAQVWYESTFEPPYKNKDRRGQFKEWRDEYLRIAAHMSHIYIAICFTPSDGQKP